MALISTFCLQNSCNMELELNMWLRAMHTVERRCSVLVLPVSKFSSLTDHLLCGSKVYHIIGIVHNSEQKTPSWYLCSMYI